MKAIGTKATEIAFDNAIVRIRLIFSKFIFSIARARTRTARARAPAISLIKFAFRRKHTCLIISCDVCHWVHNYRVTQVYVRERVMRVCMCVCVCVQRRAHTHTHERMKTRQLFTTRVTFIWNNSLRSFSPFFPPFFRGSYLSLGWHLYDDMEYGNVCYRGRSVNTERQLQLSPDW